MAKDSNIINRDDTIKRTEFKLSKINKKDIKNDKIQEVLQAKDELSLEGNLDYL